MEYILADISYTCINCLIEVFSNKKHLTDTFKTPSPGAYFPEKVHPQGEKHAPAHSMGARTRYRKSKPQIE